MDTEHNEIDSIGEETVQLIDHLYSMTSTKMKLPDGTVEEVNPEGNIGLLAYGYNGIIAWRKKREEVYGERIYSPFITLLKNLEKKWEEEKNGGQ
jgi:hypothetical protein